MTMSELTITTSQVQGDVSVTVLHLSGHLHGATEAQLLDSARQAYEDGARHLLLDTSQLEVLSSAGLRAIQGAFKLFTPPQDNEDMRKREVEQYKSPYFKMICSNPHIYYILNITGFVQNIPVYNNFEEAIQSFR
jgi:anti-anti-sigma factor